MEKTRFVISAKLKARTYRDEWYCGSYLGELYKSVPNKMMDHPDTRAEIEEQLERWNHTRYFHLFPLISEYDFFDVTNTSPIHVLPILFGMVSNHFPLRDWCRNNYPYMDEVICAFVMGYLRKYEEYDKIMIERGPDYKHPKWYTAWEPEHIDTRNPFVKFMDTEKKGLKTS